MGILAEKASTGKVMCILTSDEPGSAKPFQAEASEVSPKVSI
jgi:hypothetical protein